MDGVMAHWSKRFEEKIVELYPHIHFPFVEDNASWDMTAGLDEEGLAAVNFVMELPGFYAELEPIEGMADALRDMVAEGHVVHICTSPYVTNPTCASDKLDWLEKHVGPGWAHRAVITSDKTLVRGDILIDDRPEIVGTYSPLWRHVVFHAPYNRHISDHRDRLTEWANWRDVVYLKTIEAPTNERVSL